MQHKTLSLSVSVGLVLLVATTAQAQTSAGALQLALGTDFLTYGNNSVTVKQPQGNGTVDVSRDQGTVRWGFSNHSNLYLEGGYGLGDLFVIGGFMGLGGWSQKDETANGWERPSSLNFLIAPKFDVMFLPGQSIRPFVGAALGLIYQSESIKAHDNGSGITRTTDDWSATGLDLMLRGGARFFLTPGFSVDPALMFMWIPTASGSVQANLGANNVTRWDMGVSGYTIGLTVAASGWVGL
jgi:hypothetical protein